MSTPALRRASLGRVLPVIVLFFALADAGTRLLPLDLFSFRAWEALVTERPPTGPFAASRRYDNPRSFGDLASLGRRMELRRPHRERFSTDAYGYRNATSVDQADVVVIGDSFAVGSGSSDDDTLSAQLEALTGKRVYNAAGPTALHVPDVLAVAARLGMTRGTVVYEFMERARFPDPETLDRPIYRPTLTPERSFEDGARARMRDLEVSRLEIVLARELGAALEPGVRADMPVLLRTLRGGEPMLFLETDVAMFVDPERRAPQPPALVEGWVRFARELDDNGLRLVVLLVPTKYAVYEPLLAEPKPTPPGVALVDQIEALLRVAGVPVVNVTPALQQAAAAGLEHGQLVYWSDDSHWNAAGIRVAASSLASLVDAPN